MTGGQESLVNEGKKGGGENKKERRKIAKKQKKRGKKRGGNIRPFWKKYRRDENDGGEESEADREKKS